MHGAGIVEVLGGEKMLGWKVRSDMDLVNLSKRGVPGSVLSHLAVALGVTRNRMADFLPTTARTLQRYKGRKYLTPYVSERVLELAELAAYGLEVFDDQEQFLGWLNEPTKGLGGRAPKELLDTSFGVEMVRKELIRIEYGVFS
jgi:putative toxin-antitoxin system antitoxin component (TIGR02293 family)